MAPPSRAGSSHKLPPIEKSLPPPQPAANTKVILLSLFHLSYLSCCFCLRIHSIPNRLHQPRCTPWPISLKTTRYLSPAILVPPLSGHVMLAPPPPLPLLANRLQKTAIKAWVLYLPKLQVSHFPKVQVSHLSKVQVSHLPKVQVSHLPKVQVSHLPKVLASFHSHKPALTSKGTPPPPRLRKSTPTGRPR